MTVLLLSFNEQYGLNEEIHPPVNDALLFIHFILFNKTLNVSI